MHVFKAWLQYGAHLCHLDLKAPTIVGKRDTRRAWNSSRFKLLTQDCSGSNVWWAEANPAPYYATALLPSLRSSERQHKSSSAADCNPPLSLIGSWTITSYPPPPQSKEFTMCPLWGEHRAPQSHLCSIWISEVKLLHDSCFVLHNHIGYLNSNGGKMGWMDWLVVSRTLVASPIFGGFSC